MNRIIKTLDYPISRNNLDEWLKTNVDKKDLGDNLFDGHGYYKDGDSSITVYVVKKVPLIFFYNPDSDDYKWKIIGDDEYVKWKDVSPAPLKMKNRF